MPEREHNLPTQFNRLDDQITRPVVDSIMVCPRSHGILSLPGEHSTASPPPPHKVDVASVLSLPRSCRGPRGRAHGVVN
jgi:hypothetical protein